MSTSFLLRLRERFSSAPNGLVLIAALLSAPVFSQDIGTASGRGTIVSMPDTPTSKEQRIAFSPKFSFAYVEGKGTARATWVVLTETKPPLKAWIAAKDRTQARQSWCQNEKAAFVAVRIDAENDALLFLCPPGAAMSNTEMMSTANGLKSIDVQFKKQDAKRMVGALRGGVGFCSENGKAGYCEQHSNYSFDAVVLP